MFSSRGLNWLCVSVVWLAFGSGILAAEQHSNGYSAAISKSQLLGARADWVLPEGTCTKDIECAIEACCNGEIVSSLFQSDTH
jgi:chitinase